MNTHKLTAHKIVKLDVGKGFDFCFVLELGSITDKHGLQEKREEEISNIYLSAVVTMEAMLGKKYSNLTNNCNKPINIRRLLQLIAMKDMK